MNIYPFITRLLKHLMHPSHETITRKVVELKLNLGSLKSIQNKNNFYKKLLIKNSFFYSTIIFRYYRDNCDERCCSGSHKQSKPLLKDHVLRFKIIS